MKKPIIPYWVMYTILGAIISIFISYEIYSFKSNTTSLVEFVITVVGLVVSFTAFIIAMKTYLSIDSVNVITQMEGNVLENDNYVTPFTMLIRVYGAENSKGVSKQVFTHLNPRFEKGSKTAIDFAANLQYFIDVIIFFPYLFNPGDENREENIEKMTKLLNSVDKRVKALNSVSTGNLILIEETIKLIKSITDYQKLEVQDTFNILDVRGTMLKNAVTQTVYYNYLGLFYNQKANSILRKKYGLGETDFFSIDGLIQVKQRVGQLSSEDKELFTLYLKEAKKAFQQALEHRHNDMMWEGFIKFNEARSTYFLQIVGITDQVDWQTIMNEGLVARNLLNLLVKDIIDKDHTTYLQEAFKFENYLAGLVKMNILIAEGQPITDTFNRTKYEAPYYVGILEDPLLKETYTGNFNKVKDYQNRIIQYAEDAAIHGT
jgi:hypothetical protein